MILLGLALLVLIILLSAAVRYIRFLQLDMTRVTETTVDETVDCQVVVIRKETVVTASAAGELEPAFDNADKVRWGAVLGTMGDSRQSSVMANANGLVYYDVDGWEEVLTPDTLESISWPDILENLSSDQKAMTPEPQNLGAGRAVARIVDNLAPLYLCVFADCQWEDYLHNGKLYLRLDELPDEQLSLSIPDADELSGNEEYLMGKLSARDGIFHQMRLCGGTLVGRSSSGIAVPVSAFCTDESGNTGVYISKRRHLVFQPIEIIVQNKEIAIVEGLDITAEVAVNPAHAREGQKIY